MGNSKQIVHAIEEATNRVAEFGYKDTDKVSDRDVTLFGFGFLANHIDDREKNTVRIQFSGKKFFAFGTLVGGLIWGLFLKFIAL